MSEPRAPLRRSLPTAAAAALVGAGFGVLIGRSPVWGTVGAIIALGTALLVAVFRVRRLVAIAVATGAGVGAFLGGTIVSVLCEPRGCPLFSATAATLTGLGALVGIGLVVALVTRSFDEYREAVARDLPPPRTGCGPGTGPGSD
jgi:hypothetical protein